MPESGRAPQDYNEVTEIRLTFTLLSIIAVITVLITLLCHTNRKFETSKTARMESRKM